MHAEIVGDGAYLDRPLMESLAGPSYPFSSSQPALRRCACVCYAFFLVRHSVAGDDQDHCNDPSAGSPTDTLLRLLLPLLRSICASSRHAASQP